MKRLKNKFISATDFSRGKAIVKPFGCDENFCINKNGEILFKTQFHTFESFGIKISDKGKIISEKSLTQDFTITLPLKNEKPTLQIELLKVIYPTLQQLVNSLK